MYMLDTDMCIYLTQHRHPVVTQRFAEHEPGQVCMSVIAFVELAYGAHKSAAPAANLATLNEIRELVPVELLPAEAGIQYGKIRAGLESRGEIIGPNDLLIAAHALSGNYILVTNNEREYTRIASLHVENWTH